MADDTAVTPETWPRWRSSSGGAARHRRHIAALRVRPAPRCPCAEHTDDGTPFATSFCLTCPPAVKLVSTLGERGHGEMNRQLAEDPDLRAAYEHAHREYLRLRPSSARSRRSRTCPPVATRVKYLHALLGHTLAVGHGISPFGDEVLDRLERSGAWSPGGLLLPRAERSGCRPPAAGHPAGARLRQASRHCSDATGQFRGGGAVEDFSP